MADFEGLFKVLDDISEASAARVDERMDSLLEMNMDEAERQLAIIASDFEREYCEEMPQEVLGGQTIAGFLAGLGADDLCRMAGLHELYITGFFPKCLKDRLRELKGTEEGSKVSAAIKGMCAITDDVTASEVSSAIELYSAIPDGDFLDVIFRTLENAGRRVEQGEAEWEIATDGVFDALNSNRSAEIDDAVVAYLDEAETLSARHTNLLRYIAESRDKAEDAYRLVKKAIKESPDRPYLMELFVKIGNHRAISFIRGFIEKNPSLTDGLLLSEAIRAVTNLNGDPSDLIELYQAKYGRDQA